MMTEKGLRGVLWLSSYPSDVHGELWTWRINVGHPVKMKHEYASRESARRAAKAWAAKHGIKLEVVK